jgi:raffinose synthase
VLGSLGPEIVTETGEHGTFLSVQRSEPTARFCLPLGPLRGFRRAVALYRYEPFWMRPRLVEHVNDVPPDTQLLFVELGDGGVALVAPLLEAPFRVSLKGADGALVAVADTGDPELLATDTLLAYVAAGDSMFELVERAAPEVARRLGTVRLRREGRPPAFADDLGWCTWDAFYREVSHERVKEGLEGFRRGGVSPRLVILDDGWQPTKKKPTGEERLCDLGANAKFSGALADTVRLAKEEHGVRTFLVWHAVHGYWGGLDESAFPKLAVTTTPRWQSPEILAHFPSGNVDYWGALVGRPSAESLATFYDEYHGALAAQGVDGVKVDNQASVEAIARGVGGRVAYAAAVRHALEASVARHFEDRLINCMSCSTDLVYQTRAFGLTRSSTDFWPNRPESHGLHAYTNALVSLWFGEFVDPDWDMFQSDHPAGTFHAVLRAVSGGPVYVSDRPGSHDFALLRKLVLSDGRVLRAKHPGRPTLDCLFEDVLASDVLLKIWNENDGSWIVGAFNARHRDGADPVEGFVSPSDVPTLRGDDFAVHLHFSGRLVRARRDDRVPLSLPTLGAEIATIVPIEHGFAALGLADKLNGAAAVTTRLHKNDGERVVLKDGGMFHAYSPREPNHVFVDGVATSFEHAAARLSVRVPGAGEHEVEVAF